MGFRVRDLVIASFALVVLSPIFFIIMGWLWYTQGQVFFLQSRPGKDEQPFTLLKFSTLYPVAAGQDEASNQQLRLTPVGRILRKYSLDELPQLINVLKGEMSLVGPRPLLMEYLPLYTSAERIRHQVRPGITGWAQIHGRNSLSFKDRFELDRWYVQHRSCWLDVQILFRTIRKVYQAEGVYVDTYTTSPKFDGTN